MTIASETSIVSSVANGVATVFPYTFRILDASHLVVTVDNAVQSSGFSVSGVGSGSGGSVTFTTTPTNGAIVVLRREVPYTQTADLRNAGQFFPETHETVFDRLTMMAQQNHEDAKRSIRVPLDESGGDDLVLPSVADRANKAMTFDLNGNPTAGEIPASGVISAPMSPVVGAASLAAARAAMGPWDDALVTALGSTTARSLASRAAEMVNVKDFGAVGDGINDDTVAIQSAITYSNAHVIPEVFFPQGTYKITSQITCPGVVNSWRRLILRGQGSIINATHNGIAIFDRTGGISIRELSFVGPGKNNANSVGFSGVLVMGSIEHSSFANFSKGIDISDSIGGRILRTRVTGCSNGIYSNTGLSNLISIINCYVDFNDIGINFQNVWFSLIEQTALEVNGTSIYLNGCKSISIKETWTEQETADSIYSVDTDLTIIGCYFVNKTPRLTYTGGWAPNSTEQTNIQPHSIQSGSFYFSGPSISGLYPKSRAVSPIFDADNNILSTKIGLRAQVAAIDGIATPVSMFLGGAFISGGDGSALSQRGSNWTVARTGTGTYTILFSTLVNVPVLLLTPYGSNFASWTAIENNAGDWNLYRLAKGATVSIKNSVGTLVDGDFSIILLCSDTLVP